MAQLGKEDFEKYPVIEQPTHYRIKEVKDPPINEEFWFLEARKFWTVGKYETSYHITKMKLLWIVRTKGVLHLDVMRFISGHWTRKIYPYSELVGFTATDDSLSRVFDSKESLGKFAMKKKLIGEKLINFTEAVGIEDGYEPNFKVEKPIFEPTPQRHASRPQYIRHLASQFNWTHGALVHYQNPEQVSDILTYKELKLIVSDPFKVPRDPMTGISLYKGSLNQHELSKWLKEYQAREEFGPLRGRVTLRVEDPKQTATVLRDGLLDFVFINTSILHGKGIREMIDLWAPKVKKGGFVLGSGINHKHTYDIITERFPDWKLGYQNIWLNQQ